MNNHKLLKASAYYLEDVLGLELDKRASEGYISFILLNQPPICDAHCRRCFMPEYRRSSSLNKALTLDETKEVLENAVENGALCLEISGEGEPTLNKNIPLIIGYANSLGLLTTLITNGHCLQQEDISKYAESNVTLVFSHFSLNKQKYEADNNTLGSYEKKMDNLEYAIKVYSEHVEKIREFDVYRLAIHATLQKDNVQDALDLRDYCEKNNLFFSVAPLAEVGCAVGHQDMKLDDKITIDGEVIPISRVPNLIGHNSIIHSHSSAKELGREVCGTCYYGLNIGYDGAVLFDAHSGYEIGNMLGNIRTDNFAKILEIRRKASKLIFNNISSFCPVRDKDWNKFLQFFLCGNLKL